MEFSLTLIVYRLATPAAWRARHSARLAFFVEEAHSRCTVHVGAGADADAKIPRLPCRRARLPGPLLTKLYRCRQPFARFGKRDRGPTRQFCPCRCDSDRPSDRRLVYQGDDVVS